MKTIKINPEKIGDVIGPGGKMIRRIQDETGADINIEDDGSVTLTGPSQDSVERAEKYIRGLTDEIEIDSVYEERCGGSSISVPWWRSCPARRASSTSRSSTRSG